MNSLEEINNFLSAEKIAFFGVSGSGKKFSNEIYKTMIEKGYKLYPINPNSKNINGTECVEKFSDLKEDIKFGIFMTPKSITKDLISDAHSKGLEYIWIQPGSESLETLEFCYDNKIKVITNQCILLYLEGKKFPHNLHKFILKILNKLPN